jgi:hypothetical protein
VVGRTVVSAPWLNTTMPTSTVSGCASTNARAAAWAAPSRLGERSLAAMLVDTSMASITVPARRGTSTVACGRARPASSSGNATRISTYGT